MGSAPGSRRLGRRAVVVAALGAAAVAALAAPYGVRWLEETYAIRQLGSADRAQVEEAIATLVRLRSERGAKQVFEIAARTDASMWDWLLSPYLAEDWVLQKAHSTSLGERLLALTIIGENRISGALPMLRKVANDGDKASPMAVIALAQILPTLKLRRTEATQAGIKATFRFENLTGHKLWYYGAAGRPLFARFTRERASGPDGSGFDVPFEPGETIDLVVHFDWNELPGAVAVDIQGDAAGDTSATVVSDTVEQPRLPGPGP